MTFIVSHWFRSVLVMTLFAIAQSAHAQSSADPIGPELLKSLIAKAEKGDSEAQIFVGQLYQNGNGVPFDLEKSVAYYRRAAAGGSADGMAQLGWSYFHGLGVPATSVLFINGVTAW